MKCHWKSAGVPTAMAAAPFPRYIHFFLFLLLLLLLLLLPLLAIAAPSQTSSPPPSPSSHDHQLNNIIDALIGSGDFAGWVNLLSSTDPSSIPVTATLFIPNNDAMSNFPASSALGIVPFDPLLVPYHIVPQRLTFSDLRRLSTQTHLPTLLPFKYIVITNNSPFNFTIDDSRITQGDMYVNAAFCAHGIEKVLDYSVYGNSGQVDKDSPPKPTPISNVSDWGILPREIAAASAAGTSLGDTYTYFRFFTVLVLVALVMVYDPRLRQLDYTTH